MSNDMNINSALAQMRVMAQQAQGQERPNLSIPPGGPGEAQTEQVQFSELLGTALQQVNGYSQESARLARSFELGEPGVTLPQVMIAAQKSSLAFEALSQVRNRLVKAYQDINRMGI
jgi:flagellar hook-basal body complex protein FliE